MASQKSIKRKDFIRWKEMSSQQQQLQAEIDELQTKHLVFYGIPYPRFVSPQLYRAVKEEEQEFLAMYGLCYDDELQMFRELCDCEMFGRPQSEAAASRQAAPSRKGTACRQGEASSRASEASRATCSSAASTLANTQPAKGHKGAMGEGERMTFVQKARSPFDFDSTAMLGSTDEEGDDDDDDEDDVFEK